ncbi:leucine-rich repeat domain-containing protein [Pseudomaricurvus sp. HS19]|uniref:leucine-rich repeat domain-containing protein n=1 Tax=Pseudomaricurvus sp. HS19 TaxID=2692626 RepID=UPI00136F0F6D|nr:leucine-rich repeat domain-containing protein [Pseudomaricurvus sp. HS19]MYM65054.1 leucine-rich repeat domain-containing protein [Pseudomaricurvus sp. HS19]
MFAAALLAGCSRYQMTFNDNVVYTPPPLLTAFSTEDSALRNCLDQAIEDGAVTAPGELQQLTCSHAGLRSLKGIELFSNLKQVNLGNNSLTDLEPLRYLAKLEVLLLNDNQLQSAGVLLTLPRLQQADLNNNPSLECGDLLQLQQQAAVALTLPQQCRK